MSSHYAGSEAGRCVPTLRLLSVEAKTVGSQIQFHVACEIIFLAFIAKGNLRKPRVHCHSHTYMAGVCGSTAKAKFSISLFYYTEGSDLDVSWTQLQMG